MHFIKHLTKYVWFQVGSSGSYYIYVMMYFLNKAICCALVIASMFPFYSCTMCTSNNNDEEQSQEQPLNRKPSQDSINQEAEKARQLIEEANSEGYEAGYQNGKEDALNRASKYYRYEGCDKFSGPAYDTYKRSYENGYDEGYKAGLEELNQQESNNIRLQQQQQEEDQYQLEIQQQKQREADDWYYREELDNAYKVGYSKGVMFGKYDAMNNLSYGSNCKGSYGDETDQRIINAHAKGLIEGYKHGYYSILPGY